MSHHSVDIKWRFGGIVRLYGEDRFERFQSSHVCVIGIGGVGSWVAESLVRHGVGKITLIDMDHIAESNINRQIHAMDSTNGKSKIEAMKARIFDINPNCKVICIDDFLDEANIPIHIRSKYDFVVDAIDQTKVKINLAEYCLGKGLSFVMTGGAGGRINPECIKLTDLSKTFGDPLLTKIRQYFNKKNQSKNNKLSIPVVFSSESVQKPQQCDTAEVLTGLSCEGYGSTLNVTATFAFVATAFALSKL